MLLDQATELAVSLYPYQVAEVSWRFGGFGLAMTKTTAVVFADALLALSAIGLGSRGGLRIWAGLHVIGVVALIPTLAVFGLDFLQLRGVVRPEARLAFTITGVRAALVAAALVAVWLWAAIAGFKATRPVPQSQRSTDRPWLVTSPHPGSAVPEGPPRV